MTNEMSKRKYPQEMLLMNGCPNCGQEANRQFVENTIDEIVDLAVAEERSMISMLYRNWKRRPEADNTDFDDVISKL